MNLSYEEVEALISQISLGGKIDELAFPDQSPVVFFFKFPTPHTIAYADLLKRRALEEAEEAGLPSIEEMNKLMVRRGVWGPGKEAELSDLRDRLEGQRAVLAKTTRVPANRDRLKGIIKDLEDKVWNIQKDKELLLEHTKERKAEEERLSYLSWSGTYNPDAQVLYWSSFEEFKKDPRAVFRRAVCLKYVAVSSGLPMKTIRYIARQSQWKLRYLAAQKNGGKIFAREVYEYTVDMMNLMYWSSFYQSLNEMMSEDRPPEDIIDDDESLDAYMDDYFKEQKRKADESRSKARNSGSSAWNQDEVIVTKSNPMFKDIEYSETLAKKLERKGGSSNVLDFEEKASK